MNDASSPDKVLRKKVTMKQTGHITSNSEQKSLTTRGSSLQLTIIPFLKPKEKDNSPFVPIDVQREPKKAEKKKRGRPPKVNPVVKKFKANIKDLCKECFGNGCLSCGDRKVEVMEIESSEEADKDDEDESTKYYSKPTNKAKLDVLSRYDAYKVNPPKDINGKDWSVNDLCRDIASKTNNVVTFATAKSLIRKYNKNKNFRTALQNECLTQRGALSTKQLEKRAVRLTYPTEIDEEIIDWYYWALDIGFLVDRQVLKDTALDLVLPYNTAFKASDQ